jgi:hypothetical protein
MMIGIQEKCIGSLAKIRVGRVTVSTHIFFWSKQDINNTENLDAVFKYPDVGL